MALLNQPDRTGTKLMGNIRVLMNPRYVGRLKLGAMLREYVMWPIPRAFMRAWVNINTNE